MIRPVPKLAEYVSDFRSVLYGDLDSYYLVGWKSNFANVFCAITLAITDASTAPKVLKSLGAFYCHSCKKTEFDLNGSPFAHDEMTLQYVTCACGCPVLCMSNEEAFHKLHNSLRMRQRKRVRRARIAAAGGSHTQGEIAALAEMQRSRCLYCNRLFNDIRPATIDHLLPVSLGGDSSEPNLVLACHSCNSRRCAIPFRTFCRILSPSQNKRIHQYLIRRTRAYIEAKVSQEVHLSFATGINAHDRMDTRYRMICGMFPSARKNAISNQLLPTYPRLLRTIIATLKKEIAE